MQPAQLTLSYPVPAAPKAGPKKPEEPSKPRPATESRYDVQPFVSALSWGVKDRAGEWLVHFVGRREAQAVFDSDARAYELYNGMDPLDVMRSEEMHRNPPATLVSRKT